MKTRVIGALCALAVASFVPAMRGATGADANAAGPVIGKPSASLLIPARTKLIIGYSRIALA